MQTTFTYNDNTTQTLNSTKFLLGGLARAGSWPHLWTNFSRKAGRVTGRSKRTYVVRLVGSAHGSNLEGGRLWASGKRTARYRE